MREFCLVLIALSLFAQPVRAADPVLADLSDQVRTLIKKKDHHALEKLAVQWQGTKTSMPLCRDGQSQLMAFHDALQTYNPEVPKSFQQFFETLAAWAKDYPQSPHWRIYQAYQLASQITRDTTAADVQTHWAKATQLLTEAEASSGRLADWYPAYLRLAEVVRRQGEKGHLPSIPQPFEPWQTIADEGVGAYPHHYAIWFKSGRLAELTHFPGGMDGWARHLCQLLPTWGMDPYARLWWSQEFIEGASLFAQGNADWPTFRTGFFDILQHYPQSKRLIAKFLEFCRKAKDAETARALLPKLGDHPGSDAFPVEARFLEIREWANGRPIVRTPVWTKKFNTSCSLAWSKDATRLFVGPTSADVRILDAKTSEQIGTLTLNDERTARTINDIAVSPDGTLVAAVNGHPSSLSTKPGICKIWRTDTLQLQGQFTSKAGPLRAISWAADSAQLIASGGMFEGPGEAWLWIDGQPAQQLEWATAERHNIEAIGWAPDNSKVLFNSSSGRITVAEPAQQLRKVKQIVVPGLTWITSITFSPDSQWTAASCSYSARDQLRANGSIAIFRTSDMAPRSDALPPLTEGIMSVDWSPDGRWVAGGGYDGYVYLLDPVTLEIKQWWNPEEGAIRKVRWSPDGTQLAITTFSAWVSVWKTP